jgi:hypothetical protein
MNASQKSEALRLADKYEIEGFFQDHRFAQDHWCRQAAAELRSQHARIAELKAQLSAIAHTAEGATAQTETLRAELAEETEAADNWRRLALQFDNHRMQALGHLKAILHSDSSVDEYKAAELFLKAPPLDGEEVLAQRIAELAAAATQAQEDACWSGWACMYPTQRKCTGRQPVGGRLLAFVVCEAAPDVRVRVRGGVVDVQIEQPGVRAVAPVATVISLCPLALTSPTRA